MYFIGILEVFAMVSQAIAFPNLIRVLDSCKVNSGYEIRLPASR